MRETRLAPSLQRHAVLRPLRPGERRLDGVERSRSSVSVKTDPASPPCGTCPGPWHRPDQTDALGRAAGVAQISDRLASTGKSRRWRRIPAPCCRWSRGPRAAVVEAGSVELDELVDHAVLAQHLGDGEHEIGRGDALLELAGEPKPITSGMSMETGWPSMAASASMPPTPQPRTPRPLTIVVWLSVPTSVSG